MVQLGEPVDVKGTGRRPGTALAPPLLIVIALLIVAVGVRRSDGWGTAATVLLVPLAAALTDLTTAGALGTQ